MSLDIYAEELIKYYEHPSNKRKIEKSTANAEEENVSCGDVITAYLRLNGRKIEEATFEGSGCVISMGSASMLTEHLKGKTIDQLEKMGRDDVLKLIGVNPGPVRMHCATLSLRAFKRAVLEYEKKPLDRETKEL